ncbi:MAG: TCR/Tet family MFS transporter [Caulobacter sp.]|nr:TCR/Tet family MFS transporter [Caulobacter sp.]
MTKAISRNHRQAALGFIFVTACLDVLSLGVMIPVLPELMKRFNGGDTASTALWVVLFATTWGVMQFFCSPILGLMSDRWGRRPVILTSIFGLGVDFLFMAFAPTLWWLFVGRVFNGMTAASFSTAGAYVADVTKPEERAKGFGLMGAAFGVGFTFGPALGGWLWQFDHRLPFLVCAGLALCNWLYGFFVLPESLPPERRQPFSWARANPIGSLMHLAQLRSMGALLGVVTFASLAQFILQGTWALYTQLKFGWEPQQIGWSLCAVGAMSVLVQGVLVGRLTKLMSVQRLVVAGLVSSAAAYVAWGAASQGWVMYAVIACNVLGFAAGASLQTLIANAADPATQGRTMGAVAGLSSLTAVLAPVIGPLLLRSVADAPRGDWRMGLPYYLCAVLQLCAMAMTVLHFRRQHADSAGTPVAARS